MAAALAAGASPENAMRQAEIASATALAMQTLSASPIQPGGELAASLGAGVIPNGPAGGPAAAFASAYASALAMGLDPRQAQAAAETATRTLAAMDAAATLPPTEARKVAASLAAGDLQAALTALMPAGATPGEPGANSSALQALSAAMAAGRPLEEALAIGLRAAETERDQQIRGTVKVSAQDACVAGLATGQSSTGCNATGSADAARAIQLQAATVPVANPGLAALAEGNILADLDRNPTLRRLLGVPEPVQAEAETGDPLARLISRLARGTATTSDFEAWADVTDQRTFTTRLLASLKSGRPPADALREARAAVAGLARDAAQLDQDASTALTSAFPPNNPTGIAQASPNRNATSP
jgi:hypothetical protein